MKELKNLKRVACEELEKLDAAYANKNEFTEGDAKKYEILTHAWKSHLTAEAMEKAHEQEEEYGSSYARGRNPYNGQYMSREMDAGNSRHYPPNWLPPMSYGYPMEPMNWRY